MTAPVYRCPEHGYVDGDACDCGKTTVAVDGEVRVRLSKFLSGALRHFPDDAGLTLDEAGWTRYRDLVEAAVSRYDTVRPQHVEAVVAADPKGRFEREGKLIRAAYGHSVDVELDGTGASEDVPETLYHGTARRNAGSIREEGVVPKGRNEVYLSETAEQARQVGDRHGDPVVFEVDASSLCVVRRGNGVYAVERVPPELVSPV